MVEPANAVVQFWPVTEVQQDGGDTDIVDLLEQQSRDGAFLFPCSPF